MKIYNQHFLYRSKPWPNAINEAFSHLNTEIYSTMWGASEFTVTGNLKNYDNLDRLKYLKMPVLITNGKYDEATTSTLLKAVKRIPNARLITYNTSAHFAFLEQEKLYLSNLLKFLEH